MAPTPSPVSAAQLLRLEQPRARSASAPSTALPPKVQPPSIGKAKGFRFSTGAAPAPVASTSSLPPSKPARGARSPSPKRAVQGSPGKAVKAESPSPSKTDAKGKGRATESEIKKAKEYGDQQKSLMSRLAGPSDQKAGLSRDPEEVKQIIYEASKGSAYYLNEKRKDALLSVKVAGMVERVNGLVRARGGNLEREEAAADAMIREIEKKRDLSQAIIVVDADAFYASCHELGNPELKGTAFAVGGGVLTTASYEARKYGCRSAMAGFVAKKLCPDLKFIKLDFSLYTGISKKIMGILGEFGPISPASLDEAYCSVTEYCKSEGITPAEAAERMRARVKLETGCTVSAGVSNNCTISKIAADLNKPDGQFVVEPTKDAAIEFMRTLPCRRVPGIGRVTEVWLQGLGVETVGDIFKLRGKLHLVRKEIGLTFLLYAYLGIGRTEISVRDRSERKTVGVEETFGSMSKPVDMYEQLRKIADSLADDLAKAEYSGRTVTLTFKLDSFERFTRAITLGKETFFKDAETMYREGKKLLNKEISDYKSKVKMGKPVRGKTKEFTVRLLGLRMSNLRDDRKASSIKSKWVKSKPGTSNSAAKACSPPVKLEVKPETVDAALYEDLMEVEDFAVPASSDPLWAAIDGDGGDAFIAALDQMEADAAEDPDAVEEDERYKPFFTGGPSINSRLELDGPDSEQEMLVFGAPSTALQCPVCDKEFVGSEAALSSHVATHFEDARPAKKKRTHASQAQEVQTAATGPSNARKKKVGRKQVGTIDSYFGGRR